MKKMIFVAAALTIAVVMMSATASAQGPGGGRGGAGGAGGAGFGAGAGLAGVLRNADCKALLGISDEQSQKIDQIAQESRQRGAGAGQQADRADMERRRQETLDKYKAVLSAEQLTKAYALVFQVSGGLDAGFATAESLEALGLSNDQKAKIREINAERAARGAGGGQVDADQRRARAEETRNKIKAVLTDDQKAKAAKLTEEGKEIREKFQAAAQQRQGQGQGQRQGGQGRGNRGGGN